MDKKTNLFAEFPDISTKKWMDKIIVDLKGADYERKMVWKTKEGFNVQPFYRQEDLKDLDYLKVLPGEYPFIRGNHYNDNSWFIRQDIKVKSFKQANTKALDILNKGINSLGFIFDEEEINETDIETLFDNILLDCVEINLISNNGAYQNLLTNFFSLIDKKGYDKDRITGSINFDPIGELVLKGETYIGLEESIEKTIELIDLAKDYKNFRVITVNGKYFNNAGAVVVQDLAYTLSMGNEYLAKLTKLDVSIDNVANNIKFNLGIGGNYFMEIAKLRAARLLWSNIVNVYNPSDKDYCKMIVHTETSNWNKTIYDPNVNMLRTQTEAMSATLGGVHSLTVKPYNVYFEDPNVFSERIARNQQLILKEESHFDKIVDPSGGSYYIETLTDLIAKEAWSLFIEVEEKGGFIKTLQEGFVQQKINQTADSRRTDVARRKENILGTNQFPNTGEQILDKIDEEKIKNINYDKDDNIVKPIHQSRASEEFETLRLNTEKSGKRPVIFMLTYGNRVMRIARSQFAGNFFGCAGYEIIDNLGFETIEDGVKAAKKANADVVVLCSSDDEYTEAAPKAYELLDNNIPLVIAGAPASADKLKDIGIKYFVNVRSNVLETLQMFNDLLGIKA